MALEPSQAAGAGCHPDDAGCRAYARHRRTRDYGRYTGRSTEAGRVACALAAFHGDRYHRARDVYMFAWSSDFMSDAGIDEYEWQTRKRRIADLYTFQALKGMLIRDFEAECHWLTVCAWMSQLRRLSRSSWHRTPPQ